MNSVLLKIAIIALLIAFAIDCYYPILHLNGRGGAHFYVDNRGDFGRGGGLVWPQKINKYS